MSETNMSNGAVPPEIRVLDRSDRISLYRKINALRLDILACDWSDDKYMSYGASGGYKYLSNDKILKNVSPLIASHGLDMDIFVDELTARPAVGSKEQHWTIRGTIVLIDIDTAATDSCVIYAEAADNADMGLRKAHTILVKQWILSKFGIADGIEDIALPQGGTFKPKSPEEQEEARSKVLSLGVKPQEKPAKAAPAAPAKKETPAVSEKTQEKPAEAPKAEKDAPAPADAEKPAEPAGEAPAGKAGPIQLNGFVTEKLSKVQRSMIERAATACAMLHDANAMPDEDYDRMLDQLALIDSLQTAKTFISLYRDYKGAE